MWDDTLNNTKQGNIFRGFRGWLMNMGKDYDNTIESKTACGRVD